MEERLDMICSPGNLKGLRDYVKVFVMGPIQGAPEWQFNLPVIPGVLWICPRRPNGKYDYDEQVDWETLGLRISDFALMWIPEPAEDIKGRAYAQTTRIELGENLARGKEMVLGCYPDFPGRRYISKKAGDYGKFLYPTLEETLEELKKLVKIKTENTRRFFTSDTHFGSQRTLELSRRPFRDVKDMDWTMIERWNKVVGPNDTVYHLGDFGDSWPTDYLNGKLNLIMGNYERKDYDVPDNDRNLGAVHEIKDEYVLCHEPLKGKEWRRNESLPVLFGHIHGRQKIKPWKGLDVGVDGHNFTPVSEEDVKFYINAIEKGYYDEEVFS